jgi:ribose transport system substrate-binding protein
LTVARGWLKAAPLLLKNDFAGRGETGMNTQMRRTIVALAAAIFGMSVSAGAALAEDGLDRAKAVVDFYKTKPEFHPRGQPFDAKSCAAGKKMLSIPNSSANPFLKGIIAQEIKDGKEIGLAVTEWENQGQPNQWVQGMNFAIQSHFDIVDLISGLDPKLIGPQIKAATDSGVKTMASHFYDPSQTVDPALAESLSVDFNQVGKILADWAIVRTGGKANIVIVKTDEVPPTAPLVAGIESELAANCPDCKIVQQVNVGVTEWGTRIQPSVQSALIANPGVNFVIPIYDSMSQFVVPAIRLTGKAASVKIATFNGTPFVLDYIQQGSVDMDIGESLDWIARATIDGYLRALCGLEAPKEIGVPFYIFDSANAKDAGTPATFDRGYGSDYIAGYRALWEEK